MCVMGECLDRTVQRNVERVWDIINVIPSMVLVLRAATQDTRENFAKLYVYKELMARTGKINAVLNAVYPIHVTG